MSFTDQEKYQLLSKVNDLDKSVKSLILIIKGSDNEVTPTGLLWNTRKNTDFRQNITRWLWILTGVVTIVIVERIFSILT